MTANVASQLRCFSSFDVGAYRPHVDGPIGHSLMAADRLDLLRLAVVAILSVGLSPGVADDLPCLARVNALGDAFTVTVMGLRAHTFSNYRMLSVAEAHAVLCDMVNRNIALWVSELMRAAQRSSPGVVPPPAGTVFDPPPMPEFVRTLEFRRGGGRCSGWCSAASVPAQTGPPSGRPPLPPLGRPGPRERPIQVSPRPVGCSRAPVNATGFIVSSCTRPPGPRHPRHLHPVAGIKAVEAWRRAEGRGCCRCVRSSSRGATGGRRGWKRWFWFWMKTRALPPGGANLCGRSCGAGGGCSGCVND